MLPDDGSQAIQGGGLLGCEVWIVRWLVSVLCWLSRCVSLGCVMRAE